MQNSDYFFTIQSTQKLCEFPATREVKLAVQAMASDAVGQLAAMAACTGKQMTPEDLMRLVAELRVPGLQEKAEEIYRYITANPMTETENQ